MDLHESFEIFEVSKALDALLDGLGVVAQQAQQELGRNATEEQIADLAVRKRLG